MILSLPLFFFFFFYFSIMEWDWETERSSGITNTRKPALQENLQMCAGWGRSGCTHDPTCPARRRPEGDGDDRLPPLSFPFPMNPFSALVTEVLFRA